MSLSPSPKPPVITGIGVVAPNGIGAQAFTHALSHGHSGIRAIPFDTSMLRTHYAGCVSGLDAESVLSAPDLRRTPRTVHLAAVAAHEALRSANLLSDQPTLDTPDIGVLLGSGGGGLAFVESQYRLYFTGQKGYSPFTIVAGTHGNLSSELSIRFGLKGPSHCISTGCTSSTDALGYAALHIRAGICPAFLVGGADAPIAEGILRGFELMRILAESRDPPSAMSRPFSEDRDGFVLGEGAWMFLLEDAHRAAARGATPLAEVLGYGSTCDAYHRVQPAPDATESARALSIALHNAHLQPDALDYVNLHGTATALNDILETKALRLALAHAAPRIPMSATKSFIGHPQGASGAAGIAATILCARARFLHPTLNLHHPDPACDLDYIPLTARPLAPGARSLTALCNCIAFGSKNSAIALRIPLPN
ncbi:MAG TPA: beta-ketoacyl-[acyl-carrier-protein] synthase family protein [Phycisphaerae bacterium]|nr:beta-ketoacyl-[acyl-carrier-protein] synthase family protein [Phycisphaerae bacterium]